MVGAVVLNTVRSFFDTQKHNKSVQSVTSLDGHEEREEFMECIEDQSGLEGYVRFNVLFLKTNDQALKIQIFKQKSQLLQEVNLALEKVGYATRIVEIRMK